MQYKELIQFEPITTVVKLVNASELSVAENLVKTFVFSKKMQEDVREIIIKNLFSIGFIITTNLIQENFIIFEYPGSQSVDIMHKIIFKNLELINCVHYIF